MGITEDRMRMIASQPHKFSAAGETLYVNIGEPKIGKLEVEFGPRQGGIGMPSPTNPRPISGWSSISVRMHGKNLFDYANAEFADQKIRNDSGTEVTDGMEMYLKTPIPVNPGSKITLSGLPNDATTKRVYYLDSSLGWISRDSHAEAASFTVTIPQNCYYIQIQLRRALAQWNQVQIEYGTAATSYEAYRNTTAQVDLGGTYYGGTVDLVSGTMIVTHELVAYQSSQVNYIADKNEFKIIYLNLGSRYAPYSSTGIEVFGDQYIQGVNVLNYTNPPVYSVSTPPANPTSIFLKVYATDLPTQDIAGAQAYLNSTQPSFYVPLATPETIQLDPQTISLLRQQYIVKESANNHVAIDYWTYQRSQEPELPPEYTRLNYIQSQGAAYINTGRVLHSGYVVTLDLEVAASTSNYAFWGYRWQGSYTDPYQCYIQCNGGLRRVFFGTSFRDSGNDNAYPFDQRFTITIDSTNGTVMIDGQKITLNVNLANITDSTGSTVKIPYIGAFNNVTYAATTSNVAKYYGYTVKENGAVIQHFIPAIDPNGVYGMFDTISQSFFKSAVSEQFIGG